MVFLYEYACEITHINLYNYDHKACCVKLMSKVCEIFVKIRNKHKRRMIYESGNDRKTEKLV